MQRGDYMDQILQMILEIVREQQRDAADLRDTMTRAEVVELTMSMMEQQGVDEYHEDLEADIYKRIQYLAPRLFQHEDEPAEPEIHMEKFSYRMKPTEETILNNENLNLDYMVGNKLQGLVSPITLDTTALEYEQAYTQEDSMSLSESSTSSSTNLPDSTTPVLNSESISEQISSMDPQLSETFQDVFGQDVLNQSTIDEETLNQLVMAKYMELANSGTDNLQIDSASLASLVMQALQNTPTETEVDAESMIEDNEEVDHLLKEIWEEKESPLQHHTINEEEINKDNPARETVETTPFLAKPKTEDVPSNTTELEPISKSAKIKETLEIIQEQENASEQKIKDNSNPPENISSSQKTSPRKKSRLDSFSISSEKSSILSGLYNTKTYIDAFTDYLESLQENQLILTGFPSIDRILETGLHKGLYLVRSDYADLSSFCLQLADQMAKSDLPVCYLLFHHSRYECMAKSLSRLTYELRGKEKAITLSYLYNRKENTDFASLQTELQYYEKNIASNLYFVESAWKDIDTLLFDIEVLIQTFEQNMGQKPILILDNLSLCKEQEELLWELEDLCSDLGVILITSTNHQPFNDIEDNTYSCLDIELAELPEQDSFTKREIILEAGNSILFDISFTDGASKQKKKCQLFNIPKFYYFESR